MLKKIVVVSLLVVGLSGQTFAKEIKIGFVNVVGLLGAAPQGETSGKMLEDEFRERETEMVALQKKIERAEKKYTVDAAILGESERSKRERAILVQKRDLKRLQSEFNEDLSLRKNEELRLLQKTVLEAIDTVAREGKYDLIVNEGVVFASKEIDISKLVLTELEVAHKKITAAAAEAATAKKK